MTTFRYEFPWGIYIGDMEIMQQSIPFVIDSKFGGIIIEYDSVSEETAIDFIESITLHTLSLLPIGNVKIDIIDFGKKRFMHLSSLDKLGIYTIAFSQRKAENLFDDLEELAQVRQHDFISIDTPTISDYNVKYKTNEPYHIVLMHLADFPGELHIQRRLNNFVDMAMESGIYTIFFYDSNDIPEKKNINPIIEAFPKININQQKFYIDDILIPLKELYNHSLFKQISIDKKEYITQLFEQNKLDDNTHMEKDFLSVPIGKIGSETLYFSMGQKSEVFSVFIAGMAGTGKSNLLNVIITEIAKNYKPDEVQLYLMDYNEGGLEFFKYQKLSNAPKLFLNMNNPDKAFEVLQEFAHNMTQRAQIIKQASCSNINDYNQQCKDNKLPYKILVIDEVQSMFDGDYNQIDAFNKLVIDIAKKGRKYGLHFIFATQSMDSLKIEKAVIGQIGLTISFRLKNKLDAMKIFDEDKEAIEKVVKLSKYHFVYKSPQKTVVAKALYIPDDKINRTLEEIIASRNPDELLFPEIIDGSEESETDLQKEPSQKETLSSNTIKSTSSLYKEESKMEDEELFKKIMQVKTQNPNAFVVENGDVGNE